MSPHHIIVKFGDAIRPEDQGAAMLHMEKYLRERGVPAEVFKDFHPDDVKRRSLMTIEQRTQL